MPERLRLSEKSVPRAVLDSTILVSAFLTPKGIAAELLRYARRGAFHLYLSQEILDETQQVLQKRKHLRKRHPYSDEEAIMFCQGLRAGVYLVTDLPDLEGLSRDPSDDMVLATASKASSEYLVTRDKDLLCLQGYQEIHILSPEEFAALLRK